MEFFSNPYLMPYSTALNDPYPWLTLEETRYTKWPNFDEFFDSMFPRAPPTSFENETIEKKTFEKSPYHDEILEFLEPFNEDLKSNFLVSSNQVAPIITRLEEYCNREIVKARELMQTMKVKRFLVPYMELDLPGHIILQYNDCEIDDPILPLLRLDPEMGDKIRDLGFFLDRYDTNKEVLALIIWSTRDRGLITLPSIGNLPYPLCWSCTKNFGNTACSKCLVAKYCSKECQRDDWRRLHRKRCGEMAAFAEKHKILVIQ